MALSDQDRSEIVSLIESTVGKSMRSTVKELYDEQGLNFAQHTDDHKFIDRFRCRLRKAWSATIWTGVSIAISGLLGLVWLGLKMSIGG